MRDQQAVRDMFIGRFAAGAAGFSDYLNMIMQTPEQEVFSCREKEQERHVTWVQWERDVYACATFLSRQGYHGMHIAAAVQNCYAWFVLFFAAAISGNVMVSLNVGLAPQDLKKQLHQADVGLLYIREEDGLTAADFDGEDFLTADLAQVMRGIEMMDDQEIRRDFDSDPDKTALILFSSGTGGEPKAVMLSQTNLLSTLRDAYGKETAGGYLCSLPLYHISGIWSSLIHLAMGCRICICESAKYLLDDIRYWQPGVLGFVPMQLDYLANRCRRNAGLRTIVQNHVRQIYCLGAPLIDEHEDVFAAAGIELLNGYGMTETAGMITAMTPRKTGSIGSVSPMYDWRVKAGELQVRAKECMQGERTWGSTVAQGYYRNEEATAALFCDGWLCTGDLVTADDEGYLFIRGRKKNVIILSNGENVNPEALEEKISALAQDVLVFEHEQRIAAKVYLGSGDSLESRAAFEQALTEVNKTLPMTHRIQQLFFADEPLPRTGSGKIRRTI